jgi:hypothetical protein
MRLTATQYANMMPIVVVSCCRAMRNPLISGGESSALYRGLRDISSCPGRHSFKDTYPIAESVPTPSPVNSRPAYRYEVDCAPAAKKLPKTTHNEPANIVCFLENTSPKIPAEREPTQPPSCKTEVSQPSLEALCLTSGKLLWNEFMTTA